MYSEKLGIHIFLCYSLLETLSLMKENSISTLDKNLKLSQ